MTVLSFLRTTKYPPSLQFLLMTIGPVLLLLAWFERAPRRRWPSALAVIGRVPLFYYVVHFYLATSPRRSWPRGSTGRRWRSCPGRFRRWADRATSFPPGFGHPLWVTYVAWIAVVAVMYPLCRWYGQFKRERHPWWGSYL